MGGPQRPVPSAGSPRKPEPRSGRRLSRLFPALALLFGAFLLLDAAPAEPQAVWSATLTVKAPDDDRQRQT